MIKRIEKKGLDSLSIIKPKKIDITLNIVVEIGTPKDNEKINTVMPISNIIHPKTRLYKRETFSKRDSLILYDSLSIPCKKGDDLDIITKCLNETLFSILLFNINRAFNIGTLSFTP